MEVRWLKTLDTLNTKPRVYRMYSIPALSKGKRVGFQIVEENRQKTC